MLGAFIVYLLVLLLIGAIAKKHTKSADDFLLGGRILGPLASSLSSAATSMSGWLLLGLPGKVFSVGISGAWLGIACIFGDYLNWSLTAKRIREKTARINAQTLSEFVTGCKEDLVSRLTRHLIGCVVIFFMTMYLWAQIVATGKVLSGTLGIGLNYEEAVLIGAGSIIVYTSLGGFMAVVWTDVLQGFLMLIVLVILPVYFLILVAQTEQWNEVVSAPVLGNLELSRGDWFGGLSGFAIAAMLISNFGVGAGYLGQPQMASRFMALRSSKVAIPARRISVTWTALTVTGAIVTSMCAPVLLTAMPKDPEQVVLAMSAQFLPAWLGGVIVASVIAAIMSSADSFLMVAVSSVQKDLPRVMKGWLGQSWMPRVIVVGLGVTATLLGINTDIHDPNYSVLNLVQYAWAGISITLAIPVLYNLFCTRPQNIVVLTTVVSGIATMVFWHLSGLSDHVYELLPCLALQAVICWVSERYLFKTRS